MDDVIYEEFKGTGNSELILDRKLAEKRIFPSIDVQRSGTRREELLLEDGTLKMVWTMRRMLSAVGANEGIEILLNRLAKTQTERRVPGVADQEPRQLTVAGEHAGTPSRASARRLQRSFELMVRFADDVVSPSSTGVRPRRENPSSNPRPLDGPPIPSPRAPTRRDRPHARRPYC